MLMRCVCLLALLLVPVIASSAQEQAEKQSTSPPLKTVSASKADAVSDPLPKGVELQSTEPAEPSPSEPFQLPDKHHAWARFQPGAWREIQTRTTTLDETGEVAQKNLTIQKETLEAVADGQYVIKVQATIEVGGKQLVGEPKTRALHLETNGAGPLSETQRLENQLFTLNGEAIDCQTWELRYQEDSRNLRDLIFYSDQQFPYILLRETFVDDGTQEVTAEKVTVISEVTTAETPENVDTLVEPEPPAEAEQRIEVVAFQVPCVVDEQIIECTCLRTYRQHSKGDSVLLTFVSPIVPGGEVSASATEIDADGKRTRLSVTTLLGFGGELIPQGSSPDQPALP